MLRRTIKRMQVLADECPVFIDNKHHADLIAALSVPPIVRFIGKLRLEGSDSTALFKAFLSILSQIVIDKDFGSHCNFDMIVVRHEDDVKYEEVIARVRNGSVIEDFAKVLDRRHGVVIGIKPLSR